MHRSFSHTTEPTEVDKEALNVDSAWFYERDFYEATLSQPHPKDIQDRMDFVERRLGSVAAVRGYGTRMTATPSTGGLPSRPTRPSRR